MHIVKITSLSGCVLFRLLITILVVFGLGETGKAYADSTGVRFPAFCQTTGSGQDWSNPSRAMANDGQYATVTDNDSRQLLCVAYGFSIPTGATINGITATIERKSSSSSTSDRAEDLQVQLWRGLSAVGSNEASSAIYPRTDQAVTYGSSTYKWGTNWTAADINNALFGVVFRTNLRDDNDIVSVDYIALSVDYTLPDTTPPTVISINRAGVNPTSADNVNWTVTFNESVTGVTAANFSLVPTDLGGSVTITSVTGSGATWTVSATTGTGSGTLGLNMSSTAGIKDIAGNALTGTPPIIGAVYNIDPTAPSQCTADLFDRANGNPGGDWLVGKEGVSTFTPAIVNQRLRMTDNSQSASTYASLNRLFPGAGNKIVVEFMQYSYGGNGADGIGIVLSDASQPLIAGAFGGSLGYAAKQQSLGGDTTHEGFAGGWLGVALDEFGNFSNPTEGRIGGPGQRADTVSIRGSGSGFTGYAYLRDSGTLSPGIDDAASATPSPGDRYRIIVDHSDSVHAWTSVERDTTGTGNNYVFVIPKFDAKAEAGQVAVPVNWRLSYTGATGGNTNIHEIDSLSVCSITQRPLTLHHIQLEYPARICGSGVVTVKACADAACTALYPGTVNLTLSENGSNTSWTGGNVRSFTGGQTDVTLARTSGTGNVTIGAGSISPAPTSATTCFSDGAPSNCVINFASACYAAVESGNDPATPIYTKLVNTNFTLRVLSIRAGVVNTSTNGSTSVTLVDPTAATGNCGDTNAGLVAAKTVNLTNGVGTVMLNSPVAAKNVKVRITSSGVSSCSQDNFAIRPQQFSLSTTPNLSAAGTFAAGNNFAINANSGVTSNYGGTPILNLSKVSTAPTSADVPLVGTFPQADGAISSGTFKYDDVGTLTFAQDAATDALFTAVDNVTGVVNGVDHGTTQDCVTGSTSNSLNNNRYGCVIGSSPMGPIGRFRPHHYAVQSILSASCGDKFTYMGQPSLGVQINLQALSANGVQLARYAPGYSPLSTFSIAGDNAGIAISPINNRLTPDLPAFVWNAGAYAFDSAVSFDRNAVPDGYESFALKTTITDIDGAKITMRNDAPIPDTDQVISNATALRFGRLRLANANGSEKLNLPINVVTEYWKNNTGFVTNTDDNCTQIAASSIMLRNQQGGINATNMPSNNFVQAPLIFEEGRASLVVKKPLITPISKGSTDICVDLAGDNTPGTICSAPTSANMPWLQGKWNGTLYDDDPASRATFGVFKSGPVIYLREVY